MKIGETERGRVLVAVKVYYQQAPTVDDGMGRMYCTADGGFY